MANACEHLRPDWDGQRLSAWGEFLYQLSLPVNLVALAIVLLLAAIPSRIAITLAIVVAAAHTYTNVDPDPAFIIDEMYEAHLEGCVGSPEVWLGFGALVFVLLFFRAWRLFRRGTT